MPLGQKIGWIMEVLAINDERVTQNVMQTVWAMTGATVHRLLAIDNKSENRLTEEATTTAAGQQPTTSKRYA